MILVDTSVWVAALRRRTSAEAQELQRLLRSNAVVMVGIVMAELLQGAPSDGDIEQLERTFARLTYEEVSQDVWRRAGLLAFQLSREGRGIPLTDCIIATLAKERGHAVYTLDEHFQRVPRVRLHTVGEA